MADFGSQQVLQWLATVHGLTEQQLDAIGRKLDEAEYDGDELAEVQEKTLRRLLKDARAADCVPAILTARDAYLATNDNNESDTDRILTACGHTFCEPCLSSLLRLLPAATNKKTGGGGKTLGCPVCKTANTVPCGTPTKLPKNFVVFE